MKFKIFILTLFVTASLISCKKLDSLVDNPNSVSPDLAIVDLLLNNAQLEMVSVFNVASDVGAELTRQQLMRGPLYINAYAPTYFDQMWTSAYTDVIKSVDKLLPIALTKKNYIQAGMAQILKAYVLGTMVDCFGDIPASEANLSEINLNPKADAGADVYHMALELLDSSLANFGKTGASAGPTNDLFYAGDKTKWRKLAKTLKFKFLMQERLVDNTVTQSITDLLTENDLIADEDIDFQFKYSTNLSIPNSRHPHYNANYNNAISGSNSAKDWIANYFMYAIVAEKSGGVVSSLDPRRRYYFYRQNNGSGLRQETCPCTTQNRPAHYGPNEPFCYVGSGYWGRDHGDSHETDPDNSLRSTWGVYPAAGAFDEGSNTSGFTAIDYNKGGKGAGIAPIWLSTFTFFLKAEAAEALGINVGGSAKALLEQGVRASMNKVIGFPNIVGVTVPSIYIPNTTAIQSYVDFVLQEYDSATTSNERLAIIMKEYYLAAWGNGIEPYNNYRRTGYPNNLQPVLTNPDPGFFIRSFIYPSVFVDRNINAPTQKNPGLEANKVFWDNHPDNFIK